MPQMIDEDGDIWEVDAAGNPIRMLGNAGDAPKGIVLRKPPPEPKRQDPPSGFRWTANGNLEPIPGGPGVKPAPVPVDDVAAKTNIRAEAIAKIRLARDLAKRSREGYFTTGFGSGIAGSIRGTDAYNLAQDTETVKNASGLQRIMEMAKANGGKNPLTPLSNTDFQALVNSLTNLDPGQSDEQYQKNLKVVEDLYSRLYEQAGGTDLERALANDISGEPTGAIATGATADLKPPAEMVAELRGYAAARAGQDVDRQDFAAFYNSLAKRHNFPGGTPESIEAYRQSIKAGNFGGIDPAKRDTTALERGRNSFVANPIGAGVATYANAAGFGIPGALEGGDAINAIRENSPKMSFLGDVAGGLTGTGLAAKGLTLAGTGLPKAMTLANLGYGTGFGAASNPEDPLAGGAIGLAAGGVGEIGGRFVAAPLAEALGRKPVNAVRGLFGKPNMPAAPVLSPAERMITSTVGDQGREVTNILGNASSLGVPMTLADTTEGLRSLGGAVARRSPEARSMARNVMEPRSLGQIDRLQGAISRDFGDPTNFLERSDQLLKQAQADSRPLYNEAFQAPGASSVDATDILGTPAGKQALARARTQMLNDRKDPTALGIDIDDAGEPVLTRTPSFETLDYVKKGFDDIANEGRTPFGTFQPNADQSAAASLASNLRGRIDEVNPAYAQARAAYAGPAGEREALQMGKSAIGQSADSIGYTLRNMPAPRQEQYRLGALSGISERANNARFTTNPYEAIAGSPEAQRRLQALFPEGAARFINQANLERELAKSNSQIIGGSPTALNQRADQAFDVPLGATLAIDGASAMLAGAPPVATGARLLGGLSKDAFKLGIGKRKAEELAPLLFSPDAATAAAAFSELSKNARRADVFKKAKKRRRGIFGGLAGGATGAAITSEMQ